MTGGRDRDRVVDELLKQRAAVELGPPSGDCLDAEAVAAWMDGALAREQVAAAEAHAAGCARCRQLVAAVVRTDGVAATESTGGWSFRSALRWLVPMTAAAAAASLYLVVRPGMESKEAPSPLQSSVRQESAAPQPLEEAKAAAPAPTAQPYGGGGGRETSESARSAPAAEQDRPRASAPEASRLERAADADGLRQDARGQNARADAVGADDKRSAGLGSREARDFVQPASPPPVSLEAPVVATTPRPTAAPAAADQALAGAAASRFRVGENAVAKEVAAVPFDVPSPNRLAVWRVRPDRTVERSQDGGSTWEAQSTGAAAQLLAGSSPSATVCWLVGRAGTVLLSTDGRTWRRVTFIEPADLVDVQARDQNLATVTTADRRRFVTADGGRTWTPSPLQEFPAAPF